MIIIINIIITLFTISIAIVSTIMPIASPSTSSSSSSRRRVEMAMIAIDASFLKHVAHANATHKTFSQSTIATCECRASSVT